MAYDYASLQVTVAEGVCTAVIDHPPINLFSLQLFGDMAAFAEAVSQDDAVRVVVLKSANPDFFIAHFDVEAILAMPARAEPPRADPSQGPANDFHRMCEAFRTMGKATIAQIEGRVGGGGSELVSSFDMRFGVRGKTQICQMEVPLGIIPGGTGTQRLPRLLGRGRALEVILGGDDLDADTAEAWGYLNRALPAAEIGAFVDRLARRIASFPAPAIAAAKAAVNAAERPLAEGLAEEAYLFQTLLATDEAPRNMQRFLARGGQTAEGERAVGWLAGGLGRDEEDGSGV
ncbi:MAG: enoyl-CoA hydratase/isomerase family protein [Pseudomonadales bacterium]|nr:enoyl-CoA hydratase/isomerase family protein [Pseudomonadales bacterium]MBL6807540.1 enoyl-CoA hydratase/isomerase family protein [Pseudomonadales bacterium]MDA0955682.1 enoyl-CoA hydratase/isomerase family protein [Pseudomonadota bacterium]